MDKIKRTFLLVVAIIAFFQYARTENFIYGEYEVTTSYDSSNKTYVASLTYQGTSNYVTVPDTVANESGSKYLVTKVSGFEKDTIIETVELPNCLTSMPSFKNCKNLRNFNIPKNSKLSVVKLENFEGCDRIEKLIIPGNIKSLEASSDVFKNMKELIIEDADANRLFYMKDCGWYGAFSSIQYLYIGRETYFQEQTFIGNEYSPFLGKTSLTKVEFGPGVKVFRGGLRGCTGLSDCDIVLPESLTKIGDYAFYEICFKKVYSLSSVPPKLGLNSFSNSEALYIPWGLTETYKNANWNFFTEYRTAPMFVNFSGQGRIFFNKEIKSGDEVWGDEARLIVIPNPGFKVVSAVHEGVDVTDSIQDNILTIGERGWKTTLDITFGPADGSYDPTKDATLSIVEPTALTTTHTYPQGYAAKVVITPSADWEIASVKFNDVDVTDQLVNSTFTTPSLEGDNVLTVIRRQTIMGVDEITAGNNNISIRTDGSEVEVIGIEDGERIDIFNINGMTTYSGTDHRVILPGNATYILRTRDQAFKFRIR